MNGDGGIVFDVQRWSLNDGDGVRTVVFFKGCPLRCLWCCNPESQSYRRELAVFPDKCSDCGDCIEKCPNGVALPVRAGGFTDKSSCSGCGVCADWCPSGARETMGTYYTVQELSWIVERDMVFYRKSGGGVTFSGGEATGQPEFLRRMVARCSLLGIPTALETCGFFDWAVVGDVILKMNLVFLDMKHMDSRKHVIYTGQPNGLILDNAVRIGNSDVPMVVRIPVIPGINDDEENLRNTADFVRRNLPSCRGIELLPYHRMGVEKYRSLGRLYPMKDELQSPSDAAMESLGDIIRSCGVSVVSFK